MKHKGTKNLAILLALALLFALVPGMSGTAYADSRSDYTVAIPATLTVENSGWNDAGGISVTGTLEANKKLTVTASSDGEYALVSGGNKVAYTLAVTSGGAETTSWEFTTLPGSATLGIIVEDYSSKPAGTYTDTVTFTAAVENAGIPVESVTITNAPTKALFVNSTGTLTATVSPDNATDKTVTWSSSDPDYVSINATTGEYQVKGTNGYGSATITATAGDKTATCTITGKVTYTSLSAGTVLHVGDTFYAGKVYFNTKPAVSFQDSNGVITLVENNGCYKFQRGSNGTMPNVTSFKIKDNTDGIYIVSGSGTSSDKFVLAVHNSSIPVTSITLNKFETEIDVGQTETISVTAVTPNDATNKTVTWSSDNEAVATVNGSTDEVTAVDAGTSNITDMENDGSSIAQTETEIITDQTETRSFNSVSEADVTDKTGTWSSDNETAATVNGLTDKVTAVDAGTSNITDSDNESSSIAPKKTETEMITGQMETLIVNSMTVADVTDKTVTSSSDNEDVASVNASTDEVTAVDAGTSNIVATSNDSSGVTATCSVTVKQLYCINFTGPCTGETLTMEFFEGDTWNDMAAKYPSTIKIIAGNAAFGGDGFIIHSNGGYCSASEQINPNENYEIQ